MNRESKDRNHYNNYYIVMDKREIVIIKLYENYNDKYQHTMPNCVKEARYRVTVKRPYFSNDQDPTSRNVGI